MPSTLNWIRAIVTNRYSNLPAGNSPGSAWIEENRSNYDDVDDSLLFYFSGRELRNARTFRAAAPGFAVLDGRGMTRGGKKDV
jgi:hypothetical protein